MSKVIIKKLPKNEIEQLGIFSWPIWEKEISRFDWQYDTDEECLILEGEVEIETSEGRFSIKPGDFVTFKSGLNCIWDIKKNIKKHYSFK
ncbi:MAG: cupin domain-containing protein [Bacteroidales bacterium]|nr:cupin domain-containing protein [Bacteroidales bacterium]